MPRFARYASRIAAGWLFCCAATLAIGTCTAIESATAAERPNILVITVDDMNRDSVGSFGCKIDGITPNIDRLAAEGVAFDRAYVNIAICQPTRAVWLTGRYSHRNGALGFDEINADVPSLPEALEAAGYFNALVGKVPHSVPTRHQAFQFIRPRSKLGNGRSPEAYGNTTREVAKLAQENGQPFFLMVNSHDPHRPFAGSRQERARTRPAVSRTISLDEAVVPGFLPELKPVRRELSEYFTSVHRADDTVGEILGAIDELGLRDSTFVLFMSDHGMPLPFAKTNCYPASNRTPWIVRRPKETAAGRRDAKHFVSGIDVTPTLLEVAGAPAFDGMDGSSILPLLAGETQPERDFAFTMVNTTAGKREYTMRAVTTESHTYIWNGWADGETVFKNESQSGRTMRAMQKAAKDDPKVAERVNLFLFRTREELYQWHDDHDCLHNLVKSESDNVTLKELRGRLLALMQSTDDPALERFQKQVSQEKKAL